MFKKIKIKMRERLPKSQKNNRMIKLIACFLIAAISTSLVYAATEESRDTVMIVKVSKKITAGTEIEKSDLQMAEVGAYGLPSDVIASEDMAIGKYAKTDLYPSDNLIPDKLTDKQEDPFSVASTDKKIMSFTVSTLAASVANNIKTGDEIQVIYGQTSLDQTGINSLTNISAPDCLNGLTVIDIKDADGYKQAIGDKENVNPYETTTFIPSVLTVFVDDQQAIELYKAELSKNIYVIFISR